MKFEILNKDEYNEFLSNNSQTSFMQTIELGNLKKESNDIPHLVGIKKDGKVIATSLLLETKTILNKSIFYSPRGMILDYHNYELLSFFTEELKKYIKKNNGFILTIDPNVIYRTRSSEGEIINDDKDDFTIANLKKLNYKHFGFNIYLDSLQARWAYRLELDEDYETKKQKFSKSTRKNIDSCYKKGLQVRKGKIEDLPTLTEIFELTSKRKDFFHRSLKYYQNMYKNMSNLMTIYIAYLDPTIYYNSTLELYNNELENNKIIIEKLNKDNVGSKLLNQKETSDKLLDKYQLELDKAKKFKEENPNGKDIGCLLSIKSGNEYLTLSSGVLEEYKSFTPKYAMYDKHIKDAYQENFKYCNFYGITGDFNKENKYYGIYEFKKGFTGNVIEYIGQFELKISNFYYIYKLIKKIKNLIRR
ncbi:MAG: peptidoglycan bridge formation glycyltransferase FemA/FemB family protein [Bacilli bacterium]|nr:peptidoglycan bridge formation glycyltransferase FemA/FemB family protein [Bacilli bacterium]